MKTGIYVVEALDVNTGETVRKVVVSDSAAGAIIVSKFRSATHHGGGGEAVVGRIGDYDPGFVGAGFGPTVIATQITPAKETAR